jgi:uncharacterized protein (TIGR03067 family)
LTERAEGAMTMLHRILCIFAACSFLAAIALADDKTASDKSAKDAKRLQGTWQAVEGEANGEKLPDDQMKELKIVFKDDEVFAVKPQGEDPKNKFKLDASKKPKTIDVIPLDGPSKGKTMAGIYALKKGRLTICVNIFSEDPSVRPIEFKTKEKDGVVLVTLEREKTPPPAQ